MVNLNYPKTAEIRLVCYAARGSEFRRKADLLLCKFRFNKNSEKGDDVTVVTVHSSVISRVKSTVLLVPAGGSGLVSELSSEEIAPSHLGDLAGLFQTTIFSSSVLCKDFICTL